MSVGGEKPGRWAWRYLSKAPNAAYQMKAMYSRRNGAFGVVKHRCRYALGEGVQHLRNWQMEYSTSNS